jgi:hypothetical protein
MRQIVNTSILFALLWAGGDARAETATSEGGEPGGTIAQSSALREWTSREIDDELARVPSLLAEGSYDLATELLNSILPAVENDTPRLREVYLQLIRTYFTRANYFASRLREREAAKLFYREAETLVLQCLLNEELRDVAPEPPEEYPPEMVAAFARIRSENFGSFRILSLDPKNAVVTIDGAPLERHFGGEPDSLGLLVRNLEVGAHEIVMQAEGYRTVRDEFRVSPNSTIERSYTLSKARGVFSYLSWAGGVAVASVLAWVFIGGDEAGPALLPGPPDPPAE